MSTETIAKPLGTVPARRAGIAILPEVLLALLLLILFFLPWSSVGGLAFYDIPFKRDQLPSLSDAANTTLYVLYLVPLLCLVTILVGLMGTRARQVTRWVATVTGLVGMLGTAVFVFFMIREGRLADVGLSLYLVLLASMVLAIWAGAAKNRVPYLYILPAGLVMAGITLYPILYGVWMSMTDYQAKNLRANNPNWVWFDNYVRVFNGNLPVATIQNYDFWRILLFNFVWAVVNVFFHVTIGICVALLLNRKRLFGRRLYRAIFIIPWALPAFVSSLIWRFMFNTQFGPINQLLGGAQVPWLETSGYDIFPIPFLTFLPLAFYAVLIANIWLGWPFMSVVATGALQSVPQDLYEAAEVDGATKWQQFWNVTLPGIRPAMVPAVLLGFIWTFNQFNVIYFISQGGPYGATEILVTQAYKLVNPGRLYGIAAAFSIVVFFVLLIITLINNRITKATEGANA